MTSDPYAPLPPIRPQSAGHMRTVAPTSTPVQRVVPQRLAPESLLVSLKSLIKAGKVHPSLQGLNAVQADADAHVRLATTTTNGRPLADGIAHVDLVEGVRITQATASGMVLADWVTLQNVDRHRVQSLQKNAAIARAGKAGWEVPISGRMSPLGFAMFAGMTEQHSGRVREEFLSLWSQALSNLDDGLGLLELRINAGMRASATVWRTLPGRDLSRFDPVSVLAVTKGGAELLKYILMGRSVHEESLGQLRESALDVEGDSDE